VRMLLMDFVVVPLAAGSVGGGFGIVGAVVAVRVVVAESAGVLNAVASCGVVVVGDYSVYIVYFAAVVIIGWWVSDVFQLDVVLFLELVLMRMTVVVLRLVVFELLLFSTEVVRN